MKTILVLFLALSALCVRAQTDPELPPVPRSVTLPAETREKVNALVASMLARLRAAETAELKQRDSVAEIKAEAERAKADEIAASRALAQVERTLAEKDKTIAHLQRMALIGRVFLFLVVATVFWLAWRVAGTLPMVPPWGIVIRIGVCLAASSMAAWLLFYVVTRLL